MPMHVKIKTVIEEKDAFSIDEFDISTEDDAIEIINDLSRSSYVMFCDSIIVLQNCIRYRTIDCSRLDWGKIIKDCESIRGNYTITKNNYHLINITISDPEDSEKYYKFYYDPHNRYFTLTENSDTANIVFDDSTLKDNKLIKFIHHSVVVGFNSVPARRISNLKDIYGANNFNWVVDMGLSYINYLSENDRSQFFKILKKNNINVKQNKEWIGLEFYDEENDLTVCACSNDTYRDQNGDLISWGPKYHNFIQMLHKFAIILLQSEFVYTNFIFMIPENFSDLIPTDEVDAFLSNGNNIHYIQMKSEEDE